MSNLSAIPDFCGDAPVDVPDHFSEAGAKRAARECAIRWAEAGWAGVAFRVEPVAKVAGNVVYGVRSTLVNGLPPASARRLKGAA